MIQNRDSNPDTESIGAILVDDEELAREILREFLLGYPDIHILAECSNGFEAVKAVAEKKPQLVFLDIQMPKLNGFEVLELIGTAPAVVFTTAFDEHALRAFEVNAVDYLLKPISPERFAESVQRARQRLQKWEALPITDLLKTHRENRPLRRVLIRDGTKVHILPVETIDYVQAQDDYACFFAGGKQFLKQQTLNELEKQMDAGRFIRIHRSYILNVERMVRIELYSKDSRIVILGNGTQLPVSRTGYSRLKPLL